MGEELVSIGFPVRNGEHRVPAVVDSLLAQDYPHLEIVVTDNASTDATEDVCRELARSDERIVYHRQVENVGLLRNFQTAIEVASGAYFRWIGDGDSLEPTYVSSLIAPLLADDELLLMTSGIEYQLDDGSKLATSYTTDGLGSDDAADRFVELLRLYTEGFASVPDPLYGLMRRSRVAAIPRRNMLREDEIFAAKLALAGRWDHEPAILAKRGWSHDGRLTITKKLDLPRQRSISAWASQTAELLRMIDASELDTLQRRRARAAVAQLYVRRHRRRLGRGLAQASRILSLRGSGA